MAFLAAVVCVRAQSGLDQPRLGMMLDARGALRPVLGIAASVTVGGAAATEAVSFGCSRGRCLIKTAGASLEGSQWAAAPEGGALFAIGRGDALVYFPALRQLARWHAGQLEPIDLDIPGDVLALRSVSPEAVDFATRLNSGISIMRVRLTDGQIELRGQFPRIEGPAMLLEDGVLFAVRDTVILRRDDATELRFPAVGVTQFFAAGDGLIQVRTRLGQFALRTARGRELLFQIPEIQP